VDKSICAASFPCAMKVSLASGFQAGVLLTALTTVFHSYHYDFHKMSGFLELCNQGYFCVGTLFRKLFLRRMLLNGVPV
jgi:hypothetical protein